MSDNLDDLLSNIQQQCDDAAHDMFGKETSRWHNPTYARTMENPDSTGEVRGNCGDVIKIFLKIDNNTVSEASFFTTGCGPSIVSSDMVCELCMGKNIDAASEIDGEDILERLGGLPEDKTHCAHLASSAMQEALGNWMEKK
ncbi:iron-sulfur cluster assembly scaffold protein [Maridesulfovibrio salexigens]|uniref:Nitrogen-fixing NifU domain protein n=1 Tax=Maridesulfovibrio salexigens (strain ATCC 14822 / DSM 2638 / NCIMB 8403 / VKM B-1763) TaxID=526222 RepID=C6C1H8_MARSD|nr:iron-sulfur cluster assembly scaffold protein [Maridesulfovibrio salexigens]ACS81153.1 nitrogen-fixing NifU domain protein [Maridesulfovibrio salexigens DSM 2638]